LHESTRVADRLTLSYFWVLAAYELVRTLDQRWRTGATTLPDESGNRVAALKRRMERLRIPVAKMETARRFPTDSAIAYPTISRDLDSHGTSRRTRTSAGGSYLISCWISSPT
jgi:hypothetical protein